MTPSVEAPTLALDMRHIAKTFGDRRVLDIERFTVQRGEIHALLGQNGSGKSTLIKILAGYHEADPAAEGLIRVMGTDIGASSTDARRRAGLRLVHQDLGLVAEMSVLDNVYMGRSYPTRGLTIRSRAARASARVALARAGLPNLDPAERVADLAPSERTGVAIARALANDGDELPAVLVLDEPTSTLPAPEVDLLLKTLSVIAETGVAILYVTHHLEEVFRIADRVSVLRDGRMVASAVTSQTTHGEIVHQLVGAELEAVRRDAAADEVANSAPPLLVVKDLAGNGLDDVSFSVSPGEVVGFHGVTGSGRDSVLGTVFGRQGRVSGSVHVGGTELASERPDMTIRAGLAYVPADRKAHGAIMTITATENLSLPSLRNLWRHARIDTAYEAREADEWFSRLDLRPADGARLPMVSFSGGNQQKVVLAKWLRRHPLVLLLDEPTQGVDIGAKAIIHRTILKAVGSGLAVVIASSDIEELAALCSTVHVMQRGRIVDTLSGADITENELDRRLNAVGHHPAAPSEGTT